MPFCALPQDHAPSPADRLWPGHLAACGCSLTAPTPAQGLWGSPHAAPGSGAQPKPGIPDPVPPGCSDEWARPHELTLRPLSSAEGTGRGTGQPLLVPPPSPHTQPPLSRFQDQTQWPRVFCKSPSNNIYLVPTRRQAPARGRPHAVMTSFEKVHATGDSHASKSHRQR